MEWSVVLSWSLLSQPSVFFRLRRSQARSFAFIAQGKPGYEYAYGSIDESGAGGR